MAEANNLVALATSKDAYIKHMEKVSCLKFFDHRIEFLTGNPNNLNSTV